MSTPYLGLGSDDAGVHHPQIGKGFLVVEENKRLPDLHAITFVDQDGLDPSGDLVGDHDFDQRGHPSSRHDSLCDRPEAGDYDGLRHSG
jgi:hypothetical protein